MCGEGGGAGELMQIKCVWSISSHPLVPALPEDPRILRGKCPWECMKIHFCSGKESNLAHLLQILNFPFCLSSEIGAFCAISYISRISYLWGIDTGPLFQGLQSSGKQLGLVERCMWIVAISKKPAKRNLDERCFFKLILIGYSW